MQTNISGVTERQYWIGIVGGDNFEILKSKGFSFFAVGDRFRSGIKQAKPGDVLVLYRAGAGRASGFCVITTITAGITESQSRDFPGLRSLPVRVSTKLELDHSDHPLPIGAIAERLTFIKNPKHPGTSLQTHLRKIDANDYEIIAEAMRAAQHS